MATLYSDMFKGNFFEPNEIIEKHLVCQLKELSNNRIKFLESNSISDETLRSATKEKIENFRKLVSDTFSEWTAETGTSEHY